jgi:hypothetical protein
VICQSFDPICENTGNITVPVSISSNVTAFHAWTKTEEDQGTNIRSLVESLGFWVFGGLQFGDVPTNELWHVDGSGVFFKANSSGIPARYGASMSRINGDLLLVSIEM